MLDACYNTQGLSRCSVIGDSNRYLIPGEIILESKNSGGKQR